ncbi:hypothetical protein [Acinetobacter beijerinckii]|uniref:hypothetical protein n=1 Tax=Acinetobacter beijerinckii TaxID=262668 RepID=UPI00300A3B53
MTKDIEREAFEALPLAKLALDQDWVRYSEDTNTYYPNEDFCPESAPETMNFAWQSWQAAKAHEAKKLEGCVVVPVEPTDAMLFAASGRDIVAEHYGDENIMWSELRETWKAMLEAARGGNE